SLSCCHPRHSAPSLPTRRSSDLVLVFSATGRQPFGRGPGVLLRVESGRVDTEGLPPRTAQVLRRALHPDPERRMRPEVVRQALADRKSTRLNSSHVSISYAVFCL